jgi:hypothetical protein
VDGLSDIGKKHVGNIAGKHANFIVGEIKKILEGK